MHSHGEPSSEGASRPPSASQSSLIGRVEFPALPAQPMNSPEAVKDGIVSNSLFQKSSEAPRYSFSSHPLALNGGDSSSSSSASAGLYGQSAQPGSQPSSFYISQGPASCATGGTSSPLGSRGTARPASLSSSSASGACPLSLGVGGSNSCFSSTQMGAVSSFSLSPSPFAVASAGPASSGMQLQRFACASLQGAASTQQPSFTMPRTPCSPLASSRPRGVSFFAMENASSPLAAAPSSASGGAYAVGARLSLEDVRRDLQKRGLECPDSMWRDPQPDQVQGLFSFALDSVLGASMQFLRQEELSGEVKLSQAEQSFLALEGRTHLRGIGNLRWFRYCQKLANCALRRGVLGISDFNKSHLFQPTPQTLLRFCVAFCGYLRQRDSIQGEAAPLAEALETAQASHARLDEEIRLTEQQLRTLCADRDAQHQHALKLRKQRHALQTDVSSLESELSSLQEKLALQMKQQQRALYEQREVSKEVTRLMELKEDLTDQIVHSPEKLKQKRDELHQQQRTLDARLEALGDQRHTLQQRHQLVSRGLKKALKAQGILSAHRESRMEALVTARQELRGLERAFKETQQKKQTLQQTLQRMQQQYQQLHQRLLEEEQQFGDQQRELAERVQISKRAVEDFYSTLPAKQAQLRSLKERRAKLEVDIQRRRQRHEGLLAEASAIAARIEAAFSEYVERAEALRSQIPEQRSAKDFLEMGEDEGAFEEDEPLENGTERPCFKAPQEAAQGLVSLS